MSDSLRSVLTTIARRPGRELFAKWNYKTALTSATVRGALFFLMTLRAGLPEATAALATEFVWRFVMAGFYGAAIQAFGRIQPARVGMLAAVAILPAVAHLLETLVHAWRGTPNLAAAIAASVALTCLTTAFGVFAARHGAMLVGVPGRRTFREDLAMMPRLALAFAGGVWRALTRRVPVARAPWQLGGLLLALGLAMPASYGLRAAGSPDDHVLERFLSREDVAVESYRGHRHIEVTNARFRARGWMDVETVLSVEGQFTWTPRDEGGSNYIRRHVIRKALDMEAAAVAAGEPRRSAITPGNYEMSAAPQASDGTLIRMIARHPSHLLINGVMRLDSNGDLLDLRGRLAKAPSWWTTSVDVVREYRRIAGVRVAVATEVTSAVRIAGASSMRVRYEYSVINGRPVDPTDAAADGPPLPTQSAGGSR